VLGINQPPVTIRNIEVSIAEHAFESGYLTPQPPARLTGKSVAVVGSGPAGLAAAQQLTRAGHAVTVYERADRAGGLLRYGIPEFKMEKAVVERRVAQMAAEGTVFRTGVQIGTDLDARTICGQHDAVVLAVGSTVPRDLAIPGRELDGIHQAMTYLPQGNRQALGEPVPDQITATGKHVVIIGGGDTGADCLGTVHRQHPKSVTQLEILAQPPHSRPAQQPWPTYPMIFRTSGAHEEGGARTFKVSTTRFLGDDTGRVRALRLVEVEQRDGRFAEIEDTEHEIPAELVLLALGFTGPEQGGAVAQLGLDLDARGNIARNQQFMTSVPGVFAAGDAGRGQSLIVWAIAEGRTAAAEVDRYLTGSTTLPSPIEATTRPLAV
jgi:glutamate synthase (NADPH/NADH) small chain